MGRSKLECLYNFRFSTLFLALIASTELGWKMLRTNTLAYFVQLSSITEESFLTLKRQDIDINILSAI